MSTWVVTGTDTDVGKSVVTAALAAAIRQERGAVRALKPVASGVEAGTFGEDAERIAAGAGHEPLVWATFQAPVSPHRAQALEDRRLDPAALYRWLDVHRAQHTLVEAAGGWRVPLLAHPGGFIEAVALTRHLDADVIVVAADRLGVLSHTRLTVEAIRADGCRVTGVVLNRRPGVGSDASQASNLEDLQLLLDVPVVVFPTLDPADPEALLSAGQAVLSALPMRILRA